MLLCSSLPTQIVIAGVLGLAGFSPRTSEEQLALSFVFALSTADTVLLIGLMVVISRAHGDSVRDLWWGARPPGGEVALGLGLVLPAALLVALIIGVLRQAAPWLQNVPENPFQSMARGDAIDTAMFAFVAIVGGGVREELQRAFLLRRFERHLGGTTVGIVVLSVAFGLGHLVQGWDAVIATGVLGAFWAVVYVRRRSSVAPIVSHGGFNSLEVLRAALTG